MAHWTEHFGIEDNEHYDIGGQSVYDVVIGAIYNRGKLAAREYPTPECPYTREDYVHAWELGLFNAQQHYGYELVRRADADTDIPF